MQQDRERPMTDDVLTAALEKRNAVVVHFSHHANMRAGGVFPDDLQEAIRNKDEWPLSCSVLWPGHTMQPCGSVGVMFKPTIASVQSVSNTDAGSFLGSDGTDRSGGQPLNEDTFEGTFQVVGDYNEWRVLGAEVTGIFVHNTCCVEVKRPMQIPGLPDGALLSDISVTRIELTDVFDAFETLKVFTMTSSGLTQVGRP
ncbi:MAG: hypothetical protein ACRD22_19130 [Terriglobia bacterium]